MGKSNLRQQREALAQNLGLPLVEEKDRQLALVLRDIINATPAGQRSARMTALKVAVDQAATDFPE